MTRELEIQHMELSIRTWLNQLDKLFNEINNPDNDFSNIDFTHKEILDEYKKQFLFLSDRVNRTCVVYFELKGVNTYLESFKSEVRSFFKSGEDYSIMKYTNIYGEEESSVTKIFRQFLYPFKQFSSGDQKHLTGLDYLENILKSTTLIITDKAIVPSQESQVYNAVKVVLESTFPRSQAQYPGGYNNFNTLAKCYKPDILIPALNCAIEYKFATTMDELTTTIDQILPDVKGYINHSTYKLFYAVFYVKSGITTEMRFKEIWDSKKFPENWKEIYVEGPANKKAKNKK